MHATRLLPAVALILLFPARADESASAKPPAPADAKKDVSTSCCAGEEARLCPKAKTAQATAKKKPAAKKAPARPEAAANPVPAGAASMVVTKDPVTGRLRPATADEIRALNALRPQAAPVAPQVVVLPDGTKMIRLGEENMSYAVVRRNPDGTLTQTCVEGPEAAAAAQKPPPDSSAPHKEER